MSRLLAALLAPAVLLAAAPPKGKAPETFLVEDRGLAFLGPEGRETERLKPEATHGTLSPDGRLLACLEVQRPGGDERVVIRDRRGKDAPVTVPVSVGSARVFLPVWAADGRRLLVGQVQVGRGGTVQYTGAVFDLGTRKLTGLKVPVRHWVTDWSRDGRKLLTTNRLRGAVTWVNADGAGKPEYLTPDEEIASGGRLSPDGRRILYLSRPRDEEGQNRLCVMDLATKKRVVVDEAGETTGYCWSPDGRRVAYTWQRSLGKGEEAAERETILFTCDADGRNRKKVTSRKHKPPKLDRAVIHFFSVLDWR